MLKRSDGQKVHVDLQVEGLSDELEKAARALFTEFIGPAAASEAEVLKRFLKTLGLDHDDSALAEFLGGRRR